MKLVRVAEIENQPLLRRSAGVHCFREIDGQVFESPKVLHLEIEFKQRIPVSRIGNADSISTRLGEKGFDRLIGEKRIHRRARGKELRQCALGKYERSLTVKVVHNGAAPCEADLRFGCRML